MRHPCDLCNADPDTKPLEGFHASPNSIPDHRSFTVKETPKGSLLIVCRSHSKDEVHRFAVKSDQQHSDRRPS